ncbi:F0F1 ATP synthase subunit delta [Candidatus Kaiserbacteria bacterium]|nr:F0F1 ATP synthase subunit delta [Candidatus Kaiserbacteria bacterium]
MENAYAEALWKMIEAGEQPKAAVAKLRAYLERHGRANLLPKIAHALMRVAARESAKRAVVLSVARHKDIENAEREARDILKELGTSAKDMEMRVDDSLIGGWRLEGRERLVDASYKKSLLEIYNKVTNSIPRRSDVQSEVGAPTEASGYNRATE